MFAAQKMPATAHVRIGGLVDPGELGPDLVDVGVGARHTSGPQKTLGLPKGEAIGESRFLGVLAVTTSM